MEVEPGVFVTRASPDEWGPSSLSTAGEIHMLCSGLVCMLDFGDRFPASPLSRSNGLPQAGK